MRPDFYDLYYLRLNGTRLVDFWWLAECSIGVEWIEMHKEKALLINWMMLLCLMAHIHAGRLLEAIGTMKYTKVLERRGYGNYGIQRLEFCKL